MYNDNIHQINNNKPNHNNVKANDVYATLAEHDPSTNTYLCIDVYV